jgi:hypothetical protein
MEFLISGLERLADDRAIERVTATPFGDPTDASTAYSVLTKDRVRMVYSAPARRLAARIWAEDGLDSESAATVYVLGWCYRIGSTSQAVEPEDCREFIERHRRGLPPVDDSFSGNYVVVVFDTRVGRVAIQPDRWALGAAYFWASDRGIAVSSRAAAVANIAGSAFDGYSFLSIVRSTHIPFGRSLFLDVHRVLSGCYLSIVMRTARLEVKRAAPPFVDIVSRRRVESVDLVEETTRDLARRLGQTTEPSIFDLTGGNDTRLLAAGLSSEHPGGLGSGFSWNVVGADEQPDVEIARQVAGSCGWQLRRLDRLYPTDAPRSALQRAAVQGDGSCLIDASFCRIEQELTSRGGWEWLTGAIGGELLRGFWWGQEAFALGRTNRVNIAALLDYRIRPADGGVGKDLIPDWPSTEEHNEVLIEPYREIGRAGGKRLNVYKLDAMYLYRLSYSSGSWLAGLRRIRLPLLSWEFTRVALSLPWKLRRSRDLSLRVIQRLNPALCAIPTDTGAPMRPLGVRSAPSHIRIFAATTLHRVPLLIRRSTGLLGARRPINVKPAPSSWIDSLSESGKVSSIVGQSVVRSVCENARSPSRSQDSVRALYGLLTLEMLLERFPNLTGKMVFQKQGPALNFAVGG